VPLCPPRAFFFAIVLSTLQIWSLPCRAADPEAYSSVPSRIAFGVDRLFGVSLYRHVSESKSDFGDFRTVDSGVQAHLFGQTAGRGDGSDGQNPSAMPRLYFDYETEKQWIFGGTFGLSWSNGERKATSDGRSQDTYSYPSSTMTTAGLHGGIVRELSRNWGWLAKVGPQLNYETTSGDGALKDVLSFQASLNAGIFFRPTARTRLLISPYVDWGFGGVASRGLRVAGVPATRVDGKALRHGGGVSLALGWSL